EPYLIASSVLCIIAQRLVRVLCEACKRPAPLASDLRPEFGLPHQGPEVPIYRGAGCEACQQPGFRGRTVIYEILPIRSDIQALIASRAPANLIRAKALAAGMQSLRQCGWAKILAGTTTPEEVLRATLQEELEGAH